VWIEYPTSFINAGNQNLNFRKLDFSNNKLYTATTHTINGNVSGYGKIATLHYKIKSTLATDAVLNLSASQANQSNASGVIVPLTAGSASLMAIGASVGINSQFATPNSQIAIYPNPTNSSLTITSQTVLQKVELVAITGQTLYSQTPTNTSSTLNLENLANGVYFINMYQDNRIVKRERVMVNK
jgi:Secretion system C-terminal sorting domain